MRRFNILSKGKKAKILAGWGKNSDIVAIKRSTEINSFIVKYLINVGVYLNIFHKKGIKICQNLTFFALKQLKM